MLIDRSSILRLDLLLIGLVGAACTAVPERGRSGSTAGQGPQGDVGVSRSALGTSALFATGLDANGAAISPADGTRTDGHFQIVASSDPNISSRVPMAAYVVAPDSNTTGQWAENSASAQWVSPFAGTRSDQQAYTYTYRTTFTLAAGIDRTKLVLSGAWACDDECSLRLNGSATPIATNSGSDAVGTPKTFTIPEGSLTAPASGSTYTLDFVVNNSGAYETGLLVSALAAGCALDSQCQSTEFCHTATGPCTAKLGAGVAIPTIANHQPALNGTCTAEVGTAVCAAGVCDTRCTAAGCQPAQAACGYANGSGPCTATNASTVCQSGACGATSLLCVPATNGCAADADCASTQWCNTSTWTCANRLPNGGAIPTVAGHTPALTGVCSVDVGKAVCTAAVCDTRDAACGYANGSGPCTAANASTVCRSEACGTKSLLCVPATGGCAVDADCPTLQWCNTSTLTCVDRLSNGVAIPTVTGHSPALTGACTVEAATVVCSSGVCDGKDGACGYANGDGPCTSANGAQVCRSALCISPTGICGVSPVVAGCTADTDCASGKWCNTVTSTCVDKLINGTAIPSVAGHTPPLTALCTAEVGTAVCASAVCDIKDHACGYKDGTGPCTAANAATVCRSGACGASSLVCVPAASGCAKDADCASGKWCNTATSTCSEKLTNGTAIPTVAGHTPALDGTCAAGVGAAVCAAGVCDKDNLCGYADGAGPCAAANAATVCRSGACNATNNLCGVPVVSGCAKDADCASGKWCNTVTSTCVDKLVNGTAMPTVAGHAPALDGTCSVVAAASVCASGVCDMADRQCGYADGHGSCQVSDAGAVAVCRSGVCASSGLCGTIPSVECSRDADCPSTQWCNASRCVAKLAHGQPVPTVAGHDPVLSGACTAAAGASVCAGGVCDIKDNACGYADGTGTCSVVTGPAVCRSGQCSRNGTVCVPAQNGCALDTDCDAASWCDTSSFACVAKLPNDAPIPVVAGHQPALTGVCNAVVGASICASAVCDATDHKCGYANGNGPCAAQDGGAGVCRSGTCNAAGQCQGRCTTESDCASSEWCDTGVGACVPKLANGAGVPAVPGHEPPLAGVCTAAAAAVVCTSGVCDAKDNACGYADGDGPCTVGNAATACRSGQCFVAAGLCGKDVVPAGNGACSVAGVGPRDRSGVGALLGFLSTLGLWSARRRRRSPGHSPLG